MFSFKTKTNKKKKERVIAICVANFIVHVTILQNKKDNGKLMVLIKKGGVCLFDEKLRKNDVHFKTKGGVSVILINLKRGVSFQKKMDTPYTDITNRTKTR